MLRRIALICAALLLFPAFGWAAVYHIDPDTGSNSNTGLSHAQALETWAGFIAKSPTTSDDVYIKCGTTITPSAYLNITWGGTSGDLAVIGAYYMDGTDEIYGVSGDRPIISGSNYTVPATTTINGLIDFSGEDYVTIENLELYRSGSIGIESHGDYTTAGSSEYFVLSNVHINGAYRNGISILRSPYNYGAITGCEINGASYNYRVGDGSWGAAVTISHCAYGYTTFSGNYVHENYGEGILTFRASATGAANTGYLTIEDNVVWNNARADIYLDGSINNIVRRNLLIGASSSTHYAALGNVGAYQNDRWWNLYGIWLNAEVYNGAVYAAPSGNQVYNNIVVGHYRGIGVSTEGTSGTLSDVKIYNNTLIANRYNFHIADDYENFTMSGNEIKNNVSICPADSISLDTVTNYTWLDGKAGLAIDYNSWHSQPLNWAGTNDVATDSNWTKLSDWQSLTDPSLLSITDFMPLSNSTALTPGDDLGSPYNLGISVYDTSYNIPISVSTVDRDTVGWDRGAVPHQSEAPPVTYYKYIGWADSEGVPTTFPTQGWGYGSTSGNVNLYKWTATEDGELKGIRISPIYTWDATYAYGAVYKDTGDNLEVIGAVTLPNSMTTGQWSTEYNFTSGALTFSSGDDLYIGVPAAPTTASSIRLGYTSSSPAVETEDYYYTGAITVGDSCPTSIVQSGLTGYTPRITGVVVSYEATVATDSEDPVVTITAPTSDATYTLTGDNKVSLSGTATDNTTVGYITWASTDDSGNATGSLPWTTWEVNDVPVPTSGTVVTVTGEDTSENTGADALTVSFSHPANSNVIGWDQTANPPTATPGTESIAVTSDRIQMRQPWTATEGGEIAGVYVWIGNTFDVTDAWAAVFEEVGTDYVLLGYAQYGSPTPVAAKYIFVPITSAVSGQSLRFETGDKLLPGIVVNNGTSGFTYGYGGSPDQGMLRNSGTVDTSGGPATVTIASMTDDLVSRDITLTLVYTDLPGDITAPSVAITAPAAETATILSNHYLLAGTASDAVELDYVIWSRAEDDEQGIPTVSSGVWSDTIMLLYGTNTITATAYDTTGNSATDTVTITYSPEVFGGSVSGGFQ